MEPSYQWFAMRATYKREFLAQKYLNDKGIEVFIAQKKVVKVVKGIKRKVTVPVINSLIFVYAKKEDILRVKFGVDYLQFLTSKLDGKSIPLVVPFEQMEQFKKVVEDDTIDKTYFAPGDINLENGTSVKIHGGPLDGFKGVLMKVDGRRRKQFFLEVGGVLSLTYELRNYDLLEVVK